MLTTEQVTAAVNKAGLTEEDLTIVLSFAYALVQREKVRAAMTGARMAQATAIQESEAKLQELQAQFDAIEATLASRV